jgi:hypothetical protein
MRPNHRWYWAAKNAWFVEVGDKRHQLGKHPDGVPLPKKRKRGDPPPKPPKEIEQAYHRLMATASRTLPEADTLKICTVYDLFLEFSQQHHAADTYRGYKDFLQDFCEMYGTILAKDLKPLHVSRWLDAHKGWKGSRRRCQAGFQLGRR